MVFIYQMPSVNAGRGGGGAGGGGPATGQRTVFRPPWVKDGSEAAAPPPPTGPPWRRQSRTGSVATDEASGGPSGNNAASSIPPKAPNEPEKKVKVIPIMRPDSNEDSKGAEAGRNRPTSRQAESSNSARGRPAEASEKKEKVIPIMRADSNAAGKTPDGAEKKAKVIPIMRADNDDAPAARNRSGLRSVESSDVPQRGKLARQERQSEPERKTSVGSSNRTVDAPVENGLPDRDRVRQQPKQPPPRQTSQKSETPPGNEPLKRQLSRPKVNSIPPPPPPPPMAPPPPPPPMPTGDVERLPMTPAQRAKLEALRSRPRRRPDYGNLMKEVEQGKKLKHVQSNDRSQPLLPKVKAKGQFVYETEQKNIHNQLLNQIQQGVKLKRVVTNDRSKPILEGLRKFRRQMTIEEQLQKAEEEVEPEPDELDDIDKVRDDLQSTKQMLALELQNKAQAERDNRLLQARIFALEEQLQKERDRARKAEEERDRLKEATDCSIPGIGDPLDSLRAQVALAGKTAYEYQQKYQDACQKLELTKANLEDEEHKNLMLERKLKSIQEGNGNSGPNVSTSTMSVQTDPVVVVGAEVIPLTKQPSRKEIARAVAAAAAALPQSQLQGQQKQKGQEEDEESEYTEESYSESESEEESDSEEAKEERRHTREMKMLASKLKSYREKEGSAKKERKALKEQYKRLTKTLTTEKKKYKKLQKEVDKMAKLMKEEEDDEEEEEPPAEDSEEESEEESSEESSSEEEDEEVIPVEDPKAPPEKKTFRFEQMIKKHENSLGALKKGNYVFKTNIDRLKDELEKQKEMYVNLQDDLNSVLAELG